MLKGSRISSKFITCVTGEIVSVIGDFDPSLVKTFDFTRAALRTPFDGNVVYQFETMESVCARSLASSD